jgi:hypothetical protein
MKTRTLHATGRSLATVLTILASMAAIGGFLVTPEVIRFFSRTPPPPLTVLPGPLIKGMHRMPSLEDIRHSLKHVDSPAFLDQFIQYRNSDEPDGQTIAETAIRRVLKLEGSSGATTQGMLELLCGHFYLTRRDYAAAIDHFGRAKDFGQPTAANYLLQTYGERLVAQDPDHLDINTVQDSIRSMKSLVPSLDIQAEDDLRIVRPPFSKDISSFKVAPAEKAYGDVAFELSIPSSDIADNTPMIALDALVDASHSTPSLSSFDRIMERCARDTDPRKGLETLFDSALREHLKTSCFQNHLSLSALVADKLRSILLPEPRGTVLAIGVRGGVVDGADLAYPDSDAWSFSEALRSVGFEADTLLNDSATRANILAGIIKTVQNTEQGKERLLVVYFSGHGFIDNGGNAFLVATRRSDSDVEVVALQEIRALLSGYDGPSIIILDSCLNSLPYRLAKVDFTPSSTPSRVALVSAVEPGGIALEVPSRGGLFTHALTATLNEASRSWPKGKLKAQDLQAWLNTARIKTRALAAQWGVKQQPQVEIQAGVRAADWKQVESLRQGETAAAHHVSAGEIASAGERLPNGTSGDW